jgi:thioredoxin-related protein
MVMLHQWLTTLLAALLLTAAQPSIAQTTAEPPAPLAGAVEPRAVPVLGDDGLYRQSWFTTSFLDLREDHGEARREDKRFAVIFEQRGCVYCTKMHTDVLSQRYINDYVRQNFRIVQIDMWGSREVTDFDGKAMPEKLLAERWGVMFTPTIVFFKDELPVTGTGPGFGPPLEVTRMALGFGPPTFLDMFVWVRTKTYDRDRNFQRFHLARMAERDKLTPAPAR